MNGSLGSTDLKSIFVGPASRELNVSTVVLRLSGLTTVRETVTVMVVIHATKRRVVVQMVDVHLGGKAHQFATKMWTNVN